MIIFNEMNNNNTSYFTDTTFILQRKINYYSNKNKKLCFLLHLLLN